jgi:uncharacterized Rossmann fold enzyme
MQVRSATREEIQAAKAAGTPLPLFPLQLALEGCFTEEQMNSNFFATLDRGYTPINEYIGKFSGVCSLVGSGPTIRETYKDLVGDVITINGALRFLLEKGITPKFHMIWDCDPVCENFAIPNPDVTYLIASRAHPKVFERLKDCKVIVWHAAGDLNIVEIMNRPEVIAKQPCHEPLINGGTAGVTRGMYVAMTLGYSEINIFGGDSSYSDDGQTHVQGSLVHEKDINVSIGDNPPFYFRTTPEWCAQVEEYRAIHMILTQSGITLKVHGKSMLGHMHELLEAKRAHMGPQKYVEHILAQEQDRMEKTKAANEAYQAAKTPQPLEENHARV